MLTRLRVQNFKALESIDIELGQSVVFIGPNNSGKTSALQALSLWAAGVAEWNSRRQGSSATKRTGVTINRRALTQTPVFESRELWRQRRVTENRRNGEGNGQIPILIDLAVEGQTNGKIWSCALEFQHVNSETILCRPSRSMNDQGQLADEATNARIAILPPMSGLVSEEAELQQGRILTLIGEGRTAEVLRNLCLLVENKAPARWEDIHNRMQDMFGVRLEKPQRDKARGIVEMGYRDIRSDTRLDLASAGRGQLQTLLLLAYLHANPGTALLLDEPDAHLEIIRQKRIYDAINDVARITGSQIIAASHSEVILQEAAQRDLVVAFVGKPHRMDDRGTQVLKSLRDIGFDQYYLATLKKFVLYVEGASDLEFLRTFARVLKHGALQILNDVFFHYVGNQPAKARNHFSGLQEAEPQLRGYALFDHLDKNLEDSPHLPMRMWKRNEIENYVSTRPLLLRFAINPRGLEVENDLVEIAEASKRHDAMEISIQEMEAALNIIGKNAWSPHMRASEDFLTPLFRNYYKALQLPNDMAKTNFHRIAAVMQPDDVDPEIVEVLDAIVAAAARGAHV